MASIDGGFVESRLQVYTRAVFWDFASGLTNTSFQQKNYCPSCMERMACNYGKYTVFCEKAHPLNPCFNFFTSSMSFVNTCKIRSNLPLQDRIDFAYQLPPYPSESLPPEFFFVFILALLLLADAVWAALWPPSPPRRKPINVKRTLLRSDPSLLHQRPAATD